MGPNKASQDIRITPLDSTIIFTKQNRAICKGKINGQGNLASQQKTKGLFQVC